MKNKMMRIASILMAAVLLTVCAVSGTFAKYVTSANTADTARVAKWGVLLSIEGDGLFSDKYEADDETYTKSDYTVEAAENGEGATVKFDKVVAPGTPAKAKAAVVTEGDVSQAAKAGTEESKPLTFAIKGTPEVAVRIAFAFGKNFSDVVLPKGEYTDYTQLVAYNLTADDQGYNADLVGTYGYYNTFKLDADYYPVVFTLTQTKAATDDAPVADPIKGSLTEIKTALAEQFAAADYAPNTVLDAEFTLTWEWAFEKIVGEGDAAAADPIIDAADTFLGNIAAGVVEAPEGASVTLAFDLTITATQID